MHRYLTCKIIVEGTRATPQGRGKWEVGTRTCWSNGSWGMDMEGTAGESNKKVGSGGHPVRHFTVHRSIFTTDRSILFDTIHRSIFFLWNLRYHVYLFFIRMRLLSREWTLLGTCVRDFSLERVNTSRSLRTRVNISRNLRTRLLSREWTLLGACVREWTLLGTCVRDFSLESEHFILINC